MAYTINHNETIKSRVSRITFDNGEVVDFTMIKCPLYASRADNLSTSIVPDLIYISNLDECDSLFSSMPPDLADAVEESLNYWLHPDRNRSELIIWEYLKLNSVIIDNFKTMAERILDNLFPEGALVDEEDSLSLTELLPNSHILKKVPDGGSRYMIFSTKGIEFFKEVYANGNPWWDTSKPLSTI